MPNYKVDLLLRCGDSGCSEVYWVEQDDITGAVDNMEFLMGVRAPLMSIFSTIQGWRIQPLDAAGLPNGRAMSKNLQDQAPAGVADTKRDEEDVALLVKCRDADRLAIKTSWLRFLPDEYIQYQANGVFNGFPVSVGFDPYKAHLEAGGYLIRQFDADKTSNVANSWVTGVKFDATGLMTITLNDQIAAAEVGKKMKIKGYKGAYGKGVNGLRSILGVAGTEIQLDAVSKEFALTEGPGGGAWAFMEKYKFFGIFECIHEGASSHDTGRSFFLRRGRRSRRSRHQFTRVAPL